MEGVRSGREARTSSQSPGLECGAAQPNHGPDMASSDLPGLQPPPRLADCCASSGFSGLRCRHGRARGPEVVDRHADGDAEQGNRRDDRALIEDGRGEEAGSDEIDAGTSG